MLVVHCEFVYGRSSCVWLCVYYVGNCTKCSTYTPHQLFWLFLLSPYLKQDQHVFRLQQKWAVNHTQYSIHTAIQKQLPCLFAYVICIFLVDSEVDCISLSVPHREEFHCSFPDRPSSVRCSFDGEVQLVPFHWW